MRFCELHLRPFGAFEDLRLDLNSAGAGGLHLVYGPNGAGKSTTLEAIRSVLFGIQRGRSNHRYPAKELRIGAHLQRSDGQEIQYLRRNSTKAPLWSPSDEESIPLESLTPFLGELNRTQFEAIYGLDLETMTAGGEDLLQGKGDLGRALFGASLGGTHLARVRATLEKELTSLYADTAVKARVNQTLKTWNETSKSRARATTSMHAFDKERRALAKASKQEVILRAERDACRQELDSLDLVRRALGPLRRIDQARAEHEQLGQLHPLPSEQVKQLRDLQSEESALRKAQIERAEARGQRNERITTLSASIEPEVLAQEQAIEELCGRLDAFERALERLPELEATLGGVRERVGRGGAGLREGLDSASALATLQRHTQALRDTDHAWKAAREEFEAQQARSKRAQAELALADDSLEQAFAVELSKLAPFRGSLADLAKLVPPHAKVIQARGEWEDTQAAQAQQNEQRRVDLETARVEAQAELERLAGEPEGTPPTADDLGEARTKREAAWEALQDGLLGTGPAPVPAVAAYLQAVNHADHVADRLRSESERSARKAHARKQLIAVQAGFEALDRDHADGEDRAAAENGIWRAAWEFEPQDSRAMDFWVQERAALLERVSQAKQLLDEKAADSTTELDARSVKKACAEEDRDKAHEAFAQWATGIGLDPEAGVDFAGERLRELHAAGEASLTLEELEPERARLEELIAAMPREAAALAKSTGVGREVGQEDEAVRVRTRAGLLRSALQTALRAQVELDAERKTQIADDERDRVGEERLKRIGEELEAQIQSVGAADLAELMRHAEQSERMTALDRQVTEAEEELRTLPQSLTPDGARELLAGRSPSEIEAATQERRERFQELEDQHGQLREEIGGLRKEVERDGREDAARLSAEQALLAASLEEDTRRYVQVYLARHLLEREIEIHRTQNQGPLLRRAGELFEILTLGAYERLVPDVAGNRTTISARRPDNRTVGTDGMSTGTRDQLYLALRIASVEQMLASGEPMPFIADDLFVNFDDERTEAALRVLFQLADKTQVIVFSHHGSVMEIARGLADEGVDIHVHELVAERLREAPNSGAGVPKP